MSEYRKCPFCGEDILVDAKKCKHCREWLVDKDTSENKVKHAVVLNERAAEETRFVRETQPAIVNQPIPIVNVYTTPNPAPQPKQKNGIGLTGFILSLLCLVISWAPGLNIVMWILGLVFSAVGVFKKPKGFAIAGLTISLISILVIILLAAVIAEVVGEIWEEYGM